ncbi:MAG: ATP-binding protein, partial [Alphaproteobacteria bacterium]
DLIRAVGDRQQSVVVIDSQGRLIRNLLSCALFDPDEPESLADRLVLIDPSDIDRPPALNLFNPGLERLAGYSPQQREIAFNSLVDIYGRFFGALLGAELTGKQSAVFRYLARLMLTIDGATIHTLIALMDDVRPFAPQIAKLDATARRFFEKEFARKSFTATRQQIKDRLYAVLSIPTFDRLFSAPKSKVDFFDCLNSGKIVLIDTAKGLLKDEGTAIFGRFMLALIEHAITERANSDAAERAPVFLYMDEAHEYFDDTVETLLVEARKFRCGLTLAHQNLAQLSPRLRQIFMGNTSVKLAGGITEADARTLGPDMRTTADFLLAMRKHEAAKVSEFALSVRNVTPRALKISVPLGYLESHPRLDRDQRERLLARNRERIG